MSEAEGIHDPSYRKGQHDTLAWLREKLGEPNLPTLTACGKRIADLRARLAEVEAERDQLRQERGHVAEGWCREAAELEAKADALARENRRLREALERCHVVTVADGVQIVRRSPQWFVLVNGHTQRPGHSQWGGAWAEAVKMAAALAPAAVEQDGAREGQG